MTYAMFYMYSYSANHHPVSSAMFSHMNGLLSHYLVVMRPDVVVDSHS